MTGGLMFEPFVLVAGAIALVAVGVVVFLDRRRRRSYDEYKERARGPERQESDGDGAGAPGSPTDSTPPTEHAADAHSASHCSGGTSTHYGLVRAVSWSALKHLAVSALLYKYRIDHPEPRKPEFLLGGGIHCRVLEPDEFDSRYALCNITRNKRHTAYREWLEEHPGREALSPKEWEHVRRAGDAVLAHRVAAGVLKGCRHEEPLIWVDPDTGLMCKGRVDAINPEYVVDLKSDRDPSPHKFTRHAADMMYHGQLSMYQTGATVLRKIDGKAMPFIVAVAKEPPYDVAVYRMKPEDLNAGRTLCLSLMRKLEECTAAGLWPGCAPDLQYLDLPPWAAGLQDESEDW